MKESINQEQSNLHNKQKKRDIQRTTRRMVEREEMERRDVNKKKSEKIKRKRLERICSRNL